MVVSSICTTSRWVGRAHQLSGRPTSLRRVEDEVMSSLRGCAAASVCSVREKPGNTTVLRHACFIVLWGYNTAKIGVCIYLIIVYNKCTCCVAAPTCKNIMYMYMCITVDKVSVLMPFQDSLSREPWHKC